MDKALKKKVLAQLKSEVKYLRDDLKVCSVAVSSFHYGEIQAYEWFYDWVKANFKDV